MGIPLFFGLTIILLANGCPSMQGDGESRTEVGFSDYDAGGGDDTVQHQWATGECPQPDPPLESEPAVHDVVFVVINDTDTDQYLAIEGNLCDAFSVGVPQIVELHSPCGGEAPYYPQTSRYVRLAPSESYELRWDGRELVPYVAYYSVCEQYSGPATCGEQIEGALLPAERGTYELELLVIETLDDPRFTCLEVEGTMICDLTQPTTARDMYTSPIQAICPESNGLGGWSFELPESGDLTVEVQISAGITSP